MSRLEDESTRLETLLTLHRQREWHFVRPGGNLGDQLIYAGAEALAGRLGLRCRHFDAENFVPTSIGSGAAVYLHGGGGLNQWGSGRALKNFVAALSIPDALVVQGPQTCETETPVVAERLRVALAESRAREVHLYVREQASVDYLKDFPTPNVHLHLDHDTALQLRQEDLLRMGGLTRPPSPRYVLLVNRRDDEAPQNAARRYRGVVEMDPAYYCASLGHWIRVHAFASRIFTNRLHSAIGGALLGVPVTMTGGNYHKNRSVWEYSLRERGVEWLASFENELAVDNSPPLLPKWLARSWKVQRLMMRLRGVPA